MKSAGLVQKRRMDGMFHRRGRVERVTVDAVWRMDELRISDAKDLHCRIKRLLEHLCQAPVAVVAIAQEYLGAGLMRASQMQKCLLEFSVREDDVAIVTFGALGAERLS